MTLDEAIRRERLSDELRRLQMVNVAQIPGETYEDNLRRRAELRLQQDTLLKEIYGW